MHLKKLLRLVFFGLRKRFRRWAVRRCWRASLYYFIAGSFGQEHKSVLSGLIAHADKEGEIGLEVNRFKLRRNIHRIEKGLLMKPRNDIYALQYIAETIELVKLVENEEVTCYDVEQSFISWVNDVLTQYFQVVGSHPVIDKARIEYNQVVKCSAGKQGVARPYKRELAPLSITYNDMLMLSKRRRSVRWYLPKSVPREMIDKAVHVAAYSPSACNRQPFEFRIYDAPELVSKIASIPMGSSGFYEQFPCFVVVIGHLEAYSFERDRHIIYIDASLAAMAFQFALEVQGLSSCCVNWPEITEKEQQLAELLNLRPFERPIMLISLGFPDPEGLVAFSQKKPLDEIRTYNKP